MTLITARYQWALRVGVDTLVTILAAVIARATASQQSPQARTPPESPPPPPTTTTDLRDLVYELLDAHYDTALLAEQLACDDDWSAHLRYLSELQRVGRERLAEASPELVA